VNSERQVGESAGRQVSTSAGRRVSGSASQRAGESTKKTTDHWPLGTAPDVYWLARWFAWRARRGYLPSPPPPGGMDVNCLHWAA